MSALKFSSHIFGSLKKTHIFALHWIISSIVATVALHITIALAIILTPEIWRLNIW